MSRSAVKVGVDFDNTIVCCDDLFYRSAKEKGLISEKIIATKDEVRNYLRKTGRESDWIELQGHVYGKLIQEAIAFPGVRDFFARCRERGIPAVIISHKTRQPFSGPPYDLHQAARDWLMKNKFIGPEVVESSHVFFELTKEEKLRRIGEERCTLFIDDLPEFLADPRFPADVKRILFDPEKKQVAPKGVTPASSWNDIQRLLFPVS